MVFTTLTYFLLLALVFSIYWSLAKVPTLQNIVLIIASYGFYAWWDWRFCSLMLFSTLVDYLAGMAIGHSRRRAVRRIGLAVSVCVNLGVLCFFKYFGFFVENAVTLARMFGLKADPILLQIILPIGISFYTFQTMSYTLDIYFGKMRPTKNLISFTTFVCFFPQLVAGPIERAKNLLPQFETKKTFDLSVAVEGSQQILWGFFKKLVLADNLGVIANQMYTGHSATGPELMLGTICFAWQIYTDFSAYSDIAIGSARLLGISLMRNFAFPYFSQSVGEFWRRWHISLSTWFRDYVYIPLGGSRCSKGRSMVNVLVTFALSGLWHGAAWGFVIWGAVNGAALVVEKMLFRTPEVRMDQPAGGRILPSFFIVFRILAANLFILFTWVFFRSQTMSKTVEVLSRMASGVFVLSGWEKVFALVSKEKTVFIVLAMFVGVEWLTRKKPYPLCGVSLPVWLRYAICTSLIWITVYLGPSQGSAFIYFQF